MRNFIYVLLFFMLVVSSCSTTTPDASNTTSVTIEKINVPDAPKVPKFEDMKNRPTSPIDPLKRNFFVALIKEKGESVNSVEKTKEETSTEKVKGSPELDKNKAGQELGVNELNNFTVTGVMKTSKGVYAILKTATGSHIVKVGDVVENYKVKSISDGQLILIDLTTKQEKPIPY